MKKLFLIYSIIITTNYCFILASFNNKKLEAVTTTTNEKMDEGTKTIENMQSAYKGEKIVTPEYEAFSKKIEEDGYHNIELLYNAVSTAENFNALNHKALIEDAGSIVLIIIPEQITKTTKKLL